MCIYISPLKADQAMQQLIKSALKLACHFSRSDKYELNNIEQTIRELHEEVQSIGLIHKRLRDEEQS